MCAYRGCESTKVSVSLQDPEMRPPCPLKSGPRGEAGPQCDLRPLSLLLPSRAHPLPAVPWRTRSGGALGAARLRARVSAAPQGLHPRSRSPRAARAPATPPPAARPPRPHPCARSPAPRLGAPLLQAPWPPPFARRGREDSRALGRGGARAEAAGARPRDPAPPGRKPRVRGSPESWEPPWVHRRGSRLSR